MFATLVGAYPRTPLPGQPFRLRAAHARLERGEIDEAAFRVAQDDLVRELLAEQMDAGIELLTDGQVRWEDPQTAVAGGLRGFEITGLLRYFDTNTYFRQPRAVEPPRWESPITVADWTFARDAAASLAAERGVAAPPVKQCLVGPYTLGRLSDEGAVGRERLVLALAEALNEELHALHAAGTPVIQLDENALTLIGPDDDAERRLAAEALRRVVQGLHDAHLCLAVTMGDAVGVGPGVLFDLPFRSYLFDLIAGPDNWELIAGAPHERGIVCGVADARNTRPDDEPVMIWAAHYAASTSARGLDRVALSPSTGLEYLPRDRARAKVEALAAAARKATITDPEELARVIDPRAVDKRSAALGRYTPPSERPGAAADRSRA
jgi:5-methyltetrahydropteroyltriglutamate--homocysteine methyltransferase